MNTIKKFFFQLVLLASISIIFVNCKKDDDPTLKGNASFEVTDAPVDNTNITGAFVTIAAVKVNGETISNFEGKQTINLLAYQNGNTKALGLGELEAGSYSNVSLVLDYEQDANGNAPGCYVRTQDGVKHNLKSTSNASNELIINTGNFTVQENSNTTVIMDFDVRKAIKAQENASADDQYDFVSSTELSAALRFGDKAKTASIKGQLTDATNMSGDQVVVYAYKKGSFNQQTETQAQGDGKIQFKNAVTSSKVAADGKYHLAFLNEGDYELHFVSYEENSNSGALEAKAFLQVSTQLSLDVLGITLNTNTDTTVDVAVLGMISI